MPFRYTLSITFTSLPKFKQQQTNSFFIKPNRKRIMLKMFWLYNTSMEDYSLYQKRSKLLVYSVFCNVNIKLCSAKKICQRKNYSGKFFFPYVRCHYYVFQTKDNQTATGHYKSIFHSTPAFSFGRLFHWVNVRLQRCHFWYQHENLYLILCTYVDFVYDLNDHI